MKDEKKPREPQVDEEEKKEILQRLGSIETRVDVLETQYTLLTRSKRLGLRRGGK